MRNAHQKPLALQYCFQPVLREYHSAVCKCMLQSFSNHLGSSERQIIIGVQTAVHMPAPSVTLFTLFSHLAAWCKADVRVHQHVSTALQCLSTLHSCCESTHQL